MTNLQYYRKKKCISQEQLSEMSNISIRSIQQYEQGRANIDNCNIHTLVNWSNCLNIKLTDLLEDRILARKIEEQFEAQPVQNAER